MPGRGSPAGEEISGVCGDGTRKGVYQHRKAGNRLCAACREVNRVTVAEYRKQVLLRGRRRVPAVGTHRRVRAMARVGWSQRVLEQRLGMPRKTLSQVLLRQWVLEDTSAAVRGLYGELAWQQGPDRRVARIAERRGWPGPMDWDDPDDPGAIPACEIEAAHREALAMHRAWKSMMRKRRERAEQTAGQRAEFLAARRRRTGSDGAAARRRKAQVA